MTIDDALVEINKLQCSVQLQKLSRETLIGDCDASLREMLGMTDRDVYGCQRPRPLIGDLPFDVWSCRVSRGRKCFGRSMAEAIEAALSSNA